MRKILMFMVVCFISTGAVAQEAHENPIHFHGYGELHYNNFGNGDTDQMDFHRMVLGFTYKWTDRIRLNVEFDFEHAAEEMELEFAFVDYLINPYFNLRAGSMLMPVGPLNEFHEPPLFYSVERPYVHKNVIPTTWQEGGAGVFGSLAQGVNYRVYLVNGLDGSLFKGSSGIRNGRHKGAEGLSEDFALVGRLEAAAKGLRLGFSGYRGNAGQNNAALGETPVTIIETDARYRFKNLELSALYSGVDVGDTEEIKALSNQTVGEKIRGDLVEAAYHLGRHFLPQGSDLVVFARRENINTQAEVAPGNTASLSNDNKVTTIGLSLMPIRRVALKFDTEGWEAANGDSWRNYNAGIGFMY